MSANTPLADEAEALLESLAAGNRIGVLHPAVVYRGLARLLAINTLLRQAEQFRDEAIADAAEDERLSWQRRCMLRDAGPQVVDLTTHRRALPPGPFGGSAA